MRRGVQKARMRNIGTTLRGDNELQRGNQMKLHKLVLSLTASLFIVDAYAAGAPVGYVFQPDSPIRANEMNANFQELADRIDAVELSPPSAAGKLYIFATNSAVGGHGRTSMNGWCRSVDASASFCSKQRIQNAIDTIGFEFEAGFSGGWLDEFPSPSSGISTSCQGWSSNNAADSGAVLTATGTDSVGICSAVRPVVCCR